MQFLTLLVFLAVTLSTYLTTIHIAPPALKFFPEALSAVVLACVVVAGARQRFRFVAPRYLFVFFALAVILICGVLSNAMQPGPLVGGIRFYTRAIPLFFLPAVFEYSESQVKTQLRLLLAIALLQLPVSAYQRYDVIMHHRWTGDPVAGTLLISSIMSIFLVACIGIAAALMLRGQITKRTFLTLFVLFVVPTTINETKGTIFLLPIGLFLTLLVGSEPHKRMRIGVSALALMAVFGALYIPIYNYFSTINNPYPYTVEDFFSNQKLMRHYLDKESDVGSTGEVGRVDALTVPLHESASDPVRLMFGVGIGNSSVSSLGTSYTGEYFRLLGRYAGQSSGAAFLIEAGVLGLGLVLLLYWLVFIDSLHLALRDRSIFGTLALGWVGITAVMAVGTFYKTLHAFESLSYLFWYFSGLIAAHRQRLALAAPTLTPAPAPAIAARPPRLGIKPVLNGQTRFLP